MPEFTGERVVPGLVDADLFNEHFARYQFAAGLCAGKRVLDAGCGTGYGAAHLARTAAHVTAIDLSAEAIAYAKENYQAPNLLYQTGDCLALPEGPFDVVVAFEVIEHLEGWRDFPARVRTVLAPAGLFCVSTPNKVYYAESRGDSGGNAFHVHEFESAEYEAELRSAFPHVTVMSQNHVEGVAFTGGGSRPFATKIESGSPNPEDSHFFLGVCSGEPLPEIPGFLWIPRTGNILRERERHIALLAGEIALKTQWLARSKAELDSRNVEFEKLLAMFRSVEARMEEASRWAMAANGEAARRAERVAELQEELAREQVNFRGVAEGYEAKIAELEKINVRKTEWALETERRLTEEVEHVSNELARCVQLLDRSENWVVERTLQAQAAERDLAARNAELKALRDTRWYRMGERFKLFPQGV